ncbi:MAG: hypothetical protein KGS48_08745 [Bacteroidetes bacterium]|nr:hypothetical protein [Bacteroidota bacterium]
MKLSIFTASLLFASMVIWAACQSKPAENTTKPIDQPSTPSTVTTAPAPPSVHTPDTVYVEMFERKGTFFGNKNFADDTQLKAALLDSLRTVKKMGGKTPELAIKTHGTVTMGVRGAVQDLFLEIKDELK